MKHAPSKQKRLLFSALASFACASAAVGLTVPAQQASASATSLASDACGAVTYKADGSPWICTFADDFNPLGLLELGQNGLRTSNWVIGNSTLDGFFAGSSCFSNDTANVQANNGTAKLRVTRTDANYTCTPAGSPGFQTRYKGGAISTHSRFSQTYGAFEVRAKFPSARLSGVHAGFIMTPAEGNSSPYGGWPNSGEIDVSEWWSAIPDTSHSFLHYTGNEHFSWEGGVFGWGRDAAGCSVTAPADWHTYRVEWDEDSMRFLVDGQLCKEMVWSSAAYDHAGAPFDRPFHMGFLVFSEPLDQIDPAVTFPATYELDYAKAWQ